MHGQLNVKTGVKVTGSPHPRTSSPSDLDRCNGGDDKARLGQLFKKWKNYCMDNILDVKTA